MRYLSLVAVFGALVAAAPAFSAGLLRFDYTPQEISSLCRASQASLQAALDRVAKVSPAELSFQTTVLAVESATAEFSNLITPVIFLKDVSTDAAVRESAEECNTSVSKFLVDLYTRADLYAIFKAYAAKGETLPAVDAALLDEYLAGFKRNGLELSEAKQKIYLSKKKRLIEAESEFGKNVAEWKDELLVTRKELEGLPQTFIEGLSTTPEGLFRITLDYPHYYPFMENAKDPAARAKLEHKFQNRGGDANRKLLEEAIALRNDIAQLLGYPTHAAFVLERRMAKTPDQVLRFLDRLKAQLVPKGQAELAELLDLKRQELGDPQVKEFVASDWRYYDNQLKKKKFDVDTQLIKEYFPLDVVLKGMFEIYQTMLDVKFVRLPDEKAWHESVLAYRIEKKGRTVAHFYMDLFPRPGKYSHAAAFGLISGYEGGKTGYVLPIASIVANMNAPSAGNPSLLEHSEVETLFHEFGHIMHGTLTRAKYATFSGTSVKTDFVEAPSQMLENWVWEPETLAKLSGHYKDPSKPLPPELVEKLVKAKLADVALTNLRQLAFATIDMTYHTSGRVDSTAVYAKLMSEIGLIPISPGTMPQASFGHLMGGYDAGYYGYLWSRVYAADMFTRFKREGLLNPATGGDYAKWILEPGGTMDPYELIKGFLGREPNEEAFLKSLGLIGAKAAAKQPCVEKLVNGAN